MVSLQLRAAAAALGIVLSTSMIGALPAAAADSMTAPVTVAAAEDSDSFADVPTNHWAYQAVQELAADGYIKGYPDGTFRGNRPLTRYEIAAMTDRALSAIKAALINGDDVNKRAIDALKKLMTTYAGQLKDVQSQVSAIKAQQAALASQQSTFSSTVSTLTKQQAALQAQTNAATAAIAKNRGGVQISYKPATSYFDVEVNNGPYARALNTTLAGGVAPAGWYPATGANAPIAAGYGYSTGANNPGASLGQNFAWGAGQLQNSDPAGPHAQGTMVLGVKPYIKGNLDKHFSYEVRLAWTSTQDTPVGGSAASPTYCTALTPAGASCLYQDVKSNDAAIPVTLDRFYMQWASGGGWTLTAGKTGGGGGEGSRNVNQVIGFGKRTNGFSIEYRNLKTDWIEAAISGGNPMGLPSIALASANSAQTGNICTSPATVAGLQNVAGINPYCNALNTEVQTHIQLFNKDTGTAVGFANDSLNNQLWTYWDAGAGLCATSAPNQAAGVAASVAINRASCAAGFPLLNATGAYITSTGRISYNDVWFSQIIGNKKLHQQVIQYNYSWRPGTDPFASANGDCGSAKCSWTNNTSQEFTYIFASKGNILWGGAPGYGTTGAGIANSNVIYASVDLTGLNGIVYPQGPNGPWEGVGDNLGIGNFGGTQFEALQYVHWFSDNFNLNVGFVHQGTLPRTNIPAGGTACPGCYIDHVNTNTLFVNSWLAF